MRGISWIHMDFLFSVVQDFFLGVCVACVGAQYQYIVVGDGFSG